MANYNKQFNFRNGVQVDNDNLVVSPTGLVGIGTTVPTEHLDVRGNISATGFSTSPSLFAQTLEVRDSLTTPNVTFTDFIVGSGVTIGSGIVTATGSGIVTYYGDARFLQGMPTSQWKDMDVGLGFTSIYNEGNVGVGTTDPRFRFQINGTNDVSLVGFTSGVGFTNNGDILATGIVTGTAFIGIGSLLTELNASSIAYGTLSNERIPVLENTKIPNEFSVTGVITASRFDGNVQAGLVTATSGFTGDLTGTASTALSLSGTPNIVVGILTAAAVAASSFIGGITGNVTGDLTGSVVGVGATFSGDVKVGGVITGTATTATSLTSTADVDIADLTVGIASVSDFIGVGTDFKTGSIAIGNSTTSSGNDIFINRAGTEVQNATVKLWSNLGESTITIGTSEAFNGSNGQIRYGSRDLSLSYSDEESLDFINYGNGNINTYLQEGIVGLNTGSFFWHKGNQRLLALTYEGNLGIGITDPTDRLSVQGTSLFTGAATFNDNVTISGTLSAVNFAADVTGNLLNSSSNIVVNSEEQLLNGNVNTTTGISTFNKVSIGSSLYTDHVLVGTGTDVRSNEDFVIIANSGSTTFFVDDSGAIGIGTRFAIDNPDIGVNGIEKQAVFAGVGIGTTTVRCAVDFADAGTVGVTTTHRYFLPPKIGTTDRNGIGITETGATIYNTDLNKLQVYTGSAWETLTSS